jgi:hypothetical protein
LCFQCVGLRLPSWNPPKYHAGQRPCQHSSRQYPERKTQKLRHQSTCSDFE